MKTRIIIEFDNEIDSEEIKSLIEHFEDAKFGEPTDKIWIAFYDNPVITVEHID